jgi:UPF0176 protein
MEKVTILLFYKFQPIADIGWFCREHRRFCEKLGIWGKVLIASEGINGSISGTPEQAEAYKVFLRSMDGFDDIVFKFEYGLEHPFNKMIIREKKEIVALKKDVDTSKGGKRLTPEEFMKLYEDDEDFLLIDTRNDYEYKVGRFRDAINPGTRTFTQFPEFIEKIKDKKDKKIVMYCTGGIRCEKASAYMIQEGFTDVSQLDGGVISYCQALPKTTWEGKCFVFDKRLVSDIESNGEVISECFICNEKSDLFRNCKNPVCDRLDVMCNACQVKFHGCCSRECFLDFQDYSNARALKKKGQRQAVVA